MNDDKKPARTMIGVGAGPRPNTPGRGVPAEPVPIARTTTDGQLDAGEVPAVEATFIPAGDVALGPAGSTKPTVPSRPETDVPLGPAGSARPQGTYSMTRPKTNPGATMLSGGAPAKPAAAPQAAPNPAIEPTMMSGSPQPTPAKAIEPTMMSGSPQPAPKAMEATMMAAPQPAPASPVAMDATMIPQHPAAMQQTMAPPSAKSVEATMALTPQQQAGSVASTMALTPEQQAGAAAATIGGVSGPSASTVALGPATASHKHPRAPTPLPLNYDDYVGQEMCGYTIKRKLAEGGMGVVFEGVHGKIGRRGAIKLLKLEFCRSDEVVERFHQEARAVNSIRHENIVDIYDFGRDPDGRAFFVMEYLEGEPLSSRIRRGAVSWSEAFPILEQTLRALKAAHDKGFVHRDLKPDNIWLKPVDGGVQVKLLDFGIAKLVGGESPKEKLTQTGSVMGTPHYMSPEQINGSKDVDHRTDIYAMGVITYEMFAGVTPFVGDTLQAIMTGHLFKEAPRLADIPADLGVPQPIADIIDRMLVKEATGRYDAVADVIADLRDVNKQRQPAKAETLNRERPTRQSQPIAVQSAPVTAKKKKGGKGLVIGLASIAILAAAGVVVWKVTQKPADSAQVVTDPPKPGPDKDPTKKDPKDPKPTPPPAEAAIDFDAVRKDAQTTLRASLQETEPQVRVQGSDALGKIKDQPSVPTLTKLTETDPDLEVRGHTADALGLIGAQPAAQLIAKLEKVAPPALKVWYASALARLGDKNAKRRLYDYSKDKDLAVAFKAALTLADVSQPGDQDAIKALRRLAAKEAELNAIAQYAGAVLLTKLAALKDPQARKILYSVLEAKDEGARLAAAEGLAKLGDDGGKKVLQDVLANEGSPNRLVGAVALIPLGEYSGYDVIMTKLDAKDIEDRRLAARALGDIGERKSLKPLIAMLTDKNWSVRISAAAAIVAIVGLDPAVLAQASVDWTKGALASQDWAVRKAAAGVLGDMPEKDAVPLLAQAIADPDPQVRVAASKSAGKMKGAEAATKVAEAVKAEKDPVVKVEQVKALGEIGNAAARDTLVAMQAEPGKVGVFAAGSLIAVGDTSGKAKLDAAVADKSTDIRLAAVESASAAKNPIVVPTLKTGAADKVFDVRFTAAEGLARFGAEKDVAVPVLESGLQSKDPAVAGRAQSSLYAFGEKPKTDKTPAELLDSTDAKVRLATVKVVTALPVAEAVPLLRRVLQDSNQDVRRAGTEAIETIATKDKDQAIKLYKPLVTDADVVIRNKASGQLSKLVEPPPPPPKAAAVPDPKPDPAPPPPVDDVLPKVKAAADSVTAAATDAKTATDALTTLIDDIGKAVDKPATDDAAVKAVEKMAGDLDDAAKKADDAAAKVEAAAKAVADAAGSPPPPDAVKLIAEAQAAAKTARDAATAAKGRVERAAKKARDYAKAETGDPQMFVAAAEAAIAAGNLGEAKRDLDKATAAYKAAGTKNAGLDYAYAQLFDKLAAREKDNTAKLKLMQQAVAYYQRFAKAGSGGRVKRATDRAAELADEIKELGPQ